jgi:hypothetical protein
VVPEEVAIARQWPGKHTPTATDMHKTTQKLFEAVFSI